MKEDDLCYSGIGSATLRRKQSSSIRRHRLIERILTKLPSVIIHIDNCSNARDLHTVVQSIQSITTSFQVGMLSDSGILPVIFPAIVMFVTHGVFDWFNKTLVLIMTDYWSHLNLTSSTVRFEDNLKFHRLFHSTESQKERRQYILGCEPDVLHANVTRGGCAEQGALENVTVKLTYHIDNRIVTRIVRRVPWYARLRENTGFESRPYVYIEAEEREKMAISIEIIQPDDTLILQRKYEAFSDSGKVTCNCSINIIVSFGPIEYSEFIASRNVAWKRRDLG
ncbi:hypothetical protein C8Q75DRAFT_731404 [Abortiporus biennis]|nr:hypothetical protein C8Q75DRAFT_731404 [Abortiporus biennis]